MRNPYEFSRRSVIKTSVLGGTMVHLMATIRSSGMGWGEPAANDADPWRGLKIGVASYSLRKLPLDAAIKAIQRVGLHYVSIKDFHLSLQSTAEERRAVVQKFKDAGITPLSCGNISMQNDEANVR